MELYKHILEKKTANIKNYQAVTKKIIDTRIIPDPPKEIIVSTPPDPAIILLKTKKQNFKSNRHIAIKWDKAEYINNITFNKSKICVPQKGLYMFNASIRWNHNENGQRVCYFTRNGENTGKHRRFGRCRSLSLDDGDDAEINVSCIIPLDSNEYVELVCMQDSGKTLSTSNDCVASYCELSCVLIQ